VALYYADVHRTRRNGEGFRITYTGDGVSFMQADCFGEIPAGPGDRVFVDTIPLQHTEGVIDLLRRGVEVYYLRRLTLISRRREELRLPKTARGDVKALMAIDGKWFRRVTEDFLVMRRMVVAYRSLMRARQQLLNKSKALTDLERYVVKPAIKALEQQMDELAERIVNEAWKRYPAYNKLLEGLGIHDSLAGREALAELLVYVDFANGPLRGLKELFGLYKPVRSKKKKHWRIYHGCLRYALNRLAAAYYKTIPNGRQCWELVKRIRELSTAQAPG